MIPIIFAGSPDDAVFLIDEVDRSLHTSLVKNIIKLIVDSNKSSLRQFLFTAHDPNLLDVTMVRKDELFFVENIDNQSRIIKLDETNIRIDRNIKKKYIDGKIAI